jgi:hypothetical protein
MKWIYKKEIIPALLVILVISIITLFYNENETNLYKQKGIITSALITDYKYDYRGRLILKYKFIANRSNIAGSTSFPELKRGSEKYLLGHILPVIYIRDDFKKNELLVSTKQYKKLSLQIPDSLNWINNLERSW